MLGARAVLNVAETMMREGLPAEEVEELLHPPRRERETVDPDDVIWLHERG